MTEKEVMEAIDDGRITIVMQPIYSIEKKKFMSAEILTRLIDEEDNIIPPNEFIPIVECTKTMYRLELEILKKICDILSSPEIMNLGLEYVEVNLSARNAEKRDFLKRAKNIVDDAKIVHNSINIEITETAQPINQHIFFENINIIRDHDFRVSLDDFGTGTSNFHYLLNLPIKLIKLDMSIVQSAFENEKSISVIDGITQMAHTLNSKIVAEGVEDEKTFKLLEDIGVDYIQGYYFSKPLSIYEFVAFIKEHNNV